MLIPKSSKFKGKKSIIKNNDESQLMLEVADNIDKLREINLTRNNENEVLTKKTDQMFKPLTENIDSKLESVKDNFTKLTAEQNKELADVIEKTFNEKSVNVNANETTFIRDPKFDGFPEFIRNKLSSGSLSIGETLLPWFKNLEPNAYGIWYENNKYWVGKDMINEVTFDGNQLVILTHEGDVVVEDLTPGFLELLTKNKPETRYSASQKRSIFVTLKKEDIDNYARFCYDFGILYKQDGRIRNSASYKYKEFLANSIYTNKSQFLPKVARRPSANSVGRELLNKSLNRSISGRTFSTPDSSFSGTPNLNSALSIDGDGVLVISDNVKDLKKKLNIIERNMITGHTNVNFNEAQTVADLLLKRKKITKKRYLQLISDFKKYKS